MYVHLKRLMIFTTITDDEKQKHISDSKQYFASGTQVAFSETMSLKKKMHDIGLIEGGGIGQYL